MTSAISKQEIRRNPLAEALGAAVRFVQGHRAAILAVLVILAFGGTAGAGYWWYQERREDEAGRALVKAFWAMRGEQPGSSGNPEDATKRLQEVLHQYPGTRSAEEALINLGNLQFNAGKVDEALGIFNQYLTAFPRGRFLVMAGLGKAYAQEAKGDLQGAAETLSQSLDRHKDDPLAGEAYISLARVYEEMKRPEDAMRVYGEVVEKYGQTRWAQHALQRMSALKTK